jgi:hypothetical protein
MSTAVQQNAVGQVRQGSLPEDEPPTVYVSDFAKHDLPDPASDDYLAISETNVYMDLTPPSEIQFDEGWYLNKYPDVDEAVKNKLKPSAQDHFIRNGYYEGRKPREMTDDERQGLLGSFNGMPRSVLKKVTISGMTIKFDSSLRKTSRLELMLGREDIREIEIIADRVLVAKPVRFPQSNVVIRARELEFQAEGCIDTTPKFYEKRAKDVTYDAKNKSFERGEAGKHGDNAGNITLLVGDMIFPKDEAKKHLIACGSNGQGGSSARLPPPSEQVVALEHHRDVNFAFNWSRLDPSLEPKADPKGYWQEGRVIGAQLDYHTYERRLGGRYGRYEEVTITKKVGLDLNVDLPKGKQASEPGEAGRGGNGGALVSTARNWTDSQLSTYSQLLAGKAGVSKGADGEKAPVKPAKPVHVKMHGESDGLFGGGRWQTIKEDEVKHFTKIDGPRQEDKLGDEGSAGKPVVSVNELAWLHEYNVGTALRYVRDAHGRGMGKDTSVTAIIKAYSTALEANRAQQDPLLNPLRIEFQTLDGNIRNDLDVYGNPKGWVPYLSASANAVLDRTRGEQAFKQLFLAYRLRERCETLAEREAALGDLKTRSEDKLSAAQERLTESSNSLEKLQNTKDSITRQIAELEAILDKMNDSLTKGAKRNVENRGGCLVRSISLSLSCI